jgi:hypothetical protein
LIILCVISLILTSIFFSDIVSRVQKEKLRHRAFKFPKVIQALHVRAGIFEQLYFTEAALTLVIPATLILLLHCSLLCFLLLRGQLLYHSLERKTISFTAPLNILFAAYH